MSLNLIHNGYNVQRRKMYPSNPRNNLVSTVELTWENSLNQEVMGLSRLRARRQDEHQSITQNYNKAVEAKMQEEMRLNKSTFRVMPMHQSVGRYSLKDALTQEMTSHTRLRNSLNFDNPEGIQPVAVKTPKPKPIQNSSQVSRSVFGYNLNYQSFNRESYFSKILSERLEPFLNHHSPGDKISKNHSFTVNKLTPNYYE